MTKVSRYPLTSKQINELSEQIVDSALLVRNKDELALFFNELFTRTEKAMLGKRIMIVIFLKAGFTYVEISYWLKVSQNTISAIKERLETDGRGFNLVLKRLEEQKRIEQILENIKKCMAAIPKKAGPRWKFMRVM